MSDKISYVLEVLDGYSKQTKNFKKELDSLNKSAKNLEKSLKSLNSALNFKSNINQASKLANSFYGFDAKSSSAVSSKSSKIKKQFKEAEDLSRQAVISAEIVSRNKRAYYQKMRRDEVDKIGWKIVGVNYGNKRLSDNKRLLLEHSPLSIGRNSRPLRLGYSPLSIGRVNRLGLPSPEPITINPSQSGFVGGGGSIPPSNFSQPTQPQQPLRKSGFFNGSDRNNSDRGVTLKNVAKGMGYYRAIDMAVSVPSKIHDVTVEMDSLRAGLSALIPTVKGMEKATAESEIAYLRSVSNKYGFSFSDVAPSYLKLMGTGGKTDAGLIKGILENVGGYGGLIGMSGPALEGTMRGFQDMLTKQVLNAQEVNLQMQQMPGAKPMLHKAFKRFAEKRGAKGITDENVSALFTQAMATGKLPSADILREFVQVLNEMFGEEMIKKSFKLRNEEKRLSNAFQELGDQIGLLTYDAQIGAVKGMTSFVKSVGSFTSGISGFADDIMAIKNALFPEKEPEPKVENFKDKFAKTYGQTVFDLGKLTTYGAAKYTGALLTAGAVAARTGDTSPLKNYIDFVGEDFDKNYFRDKSGKNIFANDLSTIGGFMGMNNEPQKIEITIKSDNNIQVKDVKSSRPSTVKAGQR